MPFFFTGTPPLLGAAGLPDAAEPPGRLLLLPGERRLPPGEPPPRSFATPPANAIATSATTSPRTAIVLTVLPSPGAEPPHPGAWPASHVTGMSPPPRRPKADLSNSRASAEDGRHDRTRTGVTPAARPPPHHPAEPEGMARRHHDLRS
jgi:hypothetical protein